jgi:nucleoside-diphosphate-sugar epimerase
MAILLTGATGMLGQEICARLLSGGQKVYGLARTPPQPQVGLLPIRGDITRGGLEIHVCNERNDLSDVHAVIHTAASLTFDPKAREETFKINYDGTSNVLWWMKNSGVHRLFYISTAYVAGKHQGVFTEADLDLGQGFNNPYEESKFLAERYCRRFCQVHNFELTILRPSIFLGRSTDGGLAGNKFEGFYKPVECIVRGIRHFEKTLRLPPRERVEKALHIPPLPIPLTIYGDPEAAVNLIPVDIVADQVVASLSRPPGVYHVVDPHPLTVAEVYGAIYRALGLTGVSVKKDSKLPNPLSKLYNRLIHLYHPYISHGPVFTTSLEIPSVTSEMVEKAVSYWRHRHNE